MAQLTPFLAKLKHSRSDQVTRAVIEKNTIRFAGNMCCYRVPHAHKEHSKKLGCWLGEAEPSLLWKEALGRYRLNHSVSPNPEKEKLTDPTQNRVSCIPGIFYRQQ